MRNSLNENSIIVIVSGHHIWTNLGYRGLAHSVSESTNEIWGQVLFFVTMKKKKYYSDYFLMITEEKPLLVLYS